jgi:phosphoenolpyruvate synthase/pyruvate phosphate dikinase
MKTFPQYKDLIDVILPAEIFSLEKRKLSEAQISKILERKNGCAIFRDKVLNMDGLFKALKIADLEFEEQKIVEGELKGMSAFAGRATGKARLILYKNDIAKLKKGEILVSDMTSPNFVPAIRVAGAIVTDEGGTTCHAAIAAREFKIPCVVGTGSATKVIKNGDLVEVDADAGVVRIIKKKI